MDHYTLVYSDRDYNIGQAIFYDDKIKAMSAYLSAVFYGHRNIILDGHNNNLYWTTIKPVEPTEDLPF